ncbi:MAG: TetR/AcrR family transcriptional regulator [Pseudomonadota bacterium]
MARVKPKNAHHHGDLKEALIRYATEAARQGAVEDLSLRKASRDLGVSPGAAYRHFKDKAALLHAVAARGFDALADDFEAAVAFDSEAASAAEAEARFAALGAAYVSFAAANPNLWRLMFGPHGMTAGPGPATRPSTYAWLGKCLDELKGFRVIANVNDRTRFFAWTAIHGLADLRHAPPACEVQERMLVLGQCELVLQALRAADSSAQ